MLSYWLNKMHSMKGIIKLALVAGTALYLGFMASACGSKGSGTLPITQPPAITNSAPFMETKALPNAVAGEHYLAPIYISDTDGDNLNITAANLPPWLKYTQTQTKDANGTLVEIILDGSPRHSTIAPNLSQTGTYPIDISADDGTETTAVTLPLEVVANTTTDDYLRNNGTVRQVCANGCPVTDSTSLSDKFEGANLGIAGAILIYGKNIDPSKLPVDLRFFDDGKCVYDGRPAFYGTTNDGRGLLCVFKTVDAQGRLSISPWAASAKDIADQQLETHEYGHGILGDKPSNYNYQESLVWAIAAIITDRAGSMPGTDSLCDNGARHSAYTLFSDLCRLYNIDVANVPRLMELQTTTSVWDAKCNSDTVAKEINGAETNTSQAYVNAGIAADTNNCGL